MPSYYVEGSIQLQHPTTITQTKKRNKKTAVRIGKTGSI